MVHHAVDKSNDVARDAQGAHKQQQNLVHVQVAFSKCHPNETGHNFPSHLPGHTPRMDTRDQCGFPLMLCTFQLEFEMWVSMDKVQFLLSDVQFTKAHRIVLKVLVHNTDVSQNFQLRMFVECQTSSHVLDHEVVIVHALQGRVESTQTKASLVSHEKNEARFVQTDV